MTMPASARDFGVESEIARAPAVDPPARETSAAKRQRDQMLRLVAKGFYNELANYGVQKDEILRVASHLLDNLMALEKKPGEGIHYYSDIFTLAAVKNEWAERRQLSV